MALPEPLGHDDAGWPRRCWPRRHRRPGRPTGWPACWPRVAAGGIAAAVADARWPGAPVAGADGADLLRPGGRRARRPRAPPRRHPSETAVTPVPSLDPTRRLGIPAWTPVAGTLLATGDAARAAIDATADRAAVVVGAELLGLADTMITMTADYAKERRQFGTPIGSFQAVKHLLAGAQVLLEFARPVVYGAAWSIDDRARRRRRGRPRWPRPTPRRPPSRRPGCRCRSTAPSATRGSATSTSSSSGPGHWPRPGGRPPITVVGCSTRCWPSGRPPAQGTAKA